MEEIELNENKSKILEIIPRDRFFNYFDKNVPQELTSLISRDEYRQFIKQINKLKNPFLMRFLIFIDVLLGVAMLPVFFVLFEILDLRLLSIIIVSVNAVLFLILFCYLTFSNWKNKYRNKIEIKILEINNSLRSRKIPLMFRVLFNNLREDNPNPNNNNNNNNNNNRITKPNTNNNINNYDNRFKDFEMILEATYSDDINSIPNNSLCIGEAQC
ncbi:hypothetical protein DICPUDRAFT_156432 [Dictyostelium purpureum]|uniref:Uncharacterized protein n=1 Tax=Dictyostelium purpureum TaxID=5786 RepID=F0ZWK0_DICPU|nr:uncharacterized protein DICPUDRAFT_156432 [Dictyostelium purpureum]EGC31671.1 hypothetical protein DICPUDRAFT_156432 [Dictyostelium purpureum]|eukprot:XP_003291802.1 hypothetical protein DICPUDRAFT_156432 [Dictyostelium purpureum]